MDFYSNRCVSASCTNIKETKNMCIHCYNKMKYRARKKYRKTKEDLNEFETINNIPELVRYIRFKKLDNLITL